MCDTRFEERLKRIETRASSGAKAQLLAGVNETRAIGEIDTTRGVAFRPVRRSASPLLILLGVLAGFHSFDILRNFGGLNLLLVLPPEDILNLFRADPLAGAAAAVLLFSAVFSLTSLLRGRKAARMMSFSCASMGSAIGAVLPTLG